MSDSIHDDALFLYIMFLVSPVIVLIPGLLIHSFIIGVNVNDWWKGRSLTSIDHIVISLEISRMGAQCVVTLYVLLVNFIMSSQDLLYSSLFIDAVYALFIYSNIWLTSLLSIVFCLKISNLRTGLALYLRRVIDHRPGHFIAASGLLAGFVSFMTLSMAGSQLGFGGQHNTTTYNEVVSLLVNIYSITYFIGAFIPLLFYLLSSVLLFSSLYHHTVKMKKSSNLSINLEAYYSAMKFIFFTFLYNSMYFICLFFCAYFYYVQFVYLPWLHIVFGFLPVLHSSYLVYKISKLRNQMFKFIKM